MDLNQRQQELVIILKAIDGVLQNKDWQVLEEVLWKKRIEQLDRLILSEAQKNILEDSEIYKLQGRRLEAKRFSDLQKYGESLVKELEAIKLKS